MVGELSHVLRGEKILFAFVYGSFAQGTEQANSDIDLMVIGEPNMAALAGKMRVLEKKLGREINYVVYPRKEFLEKRRQGFLRNVLINQKVMVCGVESEFKRLIEGKQVKEN